MGGNKVKITKNYTFFKNIKNEKKKFLNISLGGSQEVIYNPINVMSFEKGFDRALVVIITRNSRYRVNLKRLVLKKTILNMRQYILAES